MARFKDQESLKKGEEITLSDLLSCALAQGMEVLKRDILLIRTGWLPLFHKDREAFEQEPFNEPGLSYSKELALWFQEMEIPVLGTDTIANERTYHPKTGVALPLHAALMRNLGVLMNEILWLEDLAQDCAQDHRYSFFYAGAPLKVVGGTGAPVDPIALK